jgi:hypothetical protein
VEPAHNGLRVGWVVPGGEVAPAQPEMHAGAVPARAVLNRDVFWL